MKSPLTSIPNTDDALIVANGDLEWSKQVLSGNPMDVGTPIEFQITITNNGTRPWYRPIFLWDTLSNRIDIDLATITGSQWECVLQGTSFLECAHPIVAGGLAPGASVTLTYSANVARITFGQSVYAPQQNAVQATYNSIFDNDTGNNDAVVPLSLNTTSFAIAKGLPVQIGNELEWEVTIQGGTSIPAGQVLIIHENLPAPFVSVTPNGWQCEPSPDAGVGAYSEHAQMCWFENPTGTIPSLIVRTEFVDGAVNVACPARGYRLGVQQWDFGANNQSCDASPTFSGVPIVPTDLAIVKTHTVSPWNRGQNYTYTLTISENGCRSRLAYCH